jgi:hypothetical protein
MRRKPLRGDLALKATRQAGVVLAVVLAHGALLSSASRLGVWQDRHPAVAEPPPLWVSLLFRPVPPPESDRPGPAKAVASRSFEPQPGSFHSSLPASDAVTAMPAPSLPAPASASPVTPATEPASAPPRLDLRLSREGTRRARSPSLDDPHADPPRTSLGDRVAAAMGDGRWVMQRLDANRLRFRNGPKCFEVHRSRADQIDPIGASHSPKPWGAKPC